MTGCEGSAPTDNGSATLQADADGELQFERGLSHLRSREWAAARRALNESAEIFERTHNAPGRAEALRAIGDLEKQTDQPKLAKAAFEQALQLYKEVRDVVGEASVLRRLGDLSVAEAQLPNAHGQANVFRDIGALETQFDRYERAFEAYARALPLFKDVGDRVGLANTLIGPGR